jgi:hypothetical protein
MTEENQSAQGQVQQNVQSHSLNTKTDNSLPPSAVNLPMPTTKPPKEPPSVIKPPQQPNKEI